MKGLLIKDFKLVFQNSFRFLILFVIVMFFLATNKDTNWLVPYIVSYTTMIAFIFGLTSFSYDDFENGIQFLLTLPITRKTYVKEKYVFCMGLCLIGGLFSLLLLTCAFTIRGMELPAMGFLLQNTLGNFLGSMVLLSLAIPFQIKFGATGKNIVYMVMCVIIILLVSFTQSLKGVFANADILLENISNMDERLLWVILCLIASVLLTISYGISVRILKKKEL